MKVYITGSSGFIGSYLLRILLKKGYDVLALKRRTTSLFRVDDVKDQVRWINSDEDIEKEITAFAPEVIFNLAWNGVAAAERTDLNVQSSNIPMQQRLLELAAKAGTKKFVGIGSQAEYGAFENKIDETYPAHPNSPYGVVKKESLDLLKDFAEKHAMEWFWFRLFPCFGPTEGDRWLIPSLIKSICTEHSMDLTAGEQKLAYLYVGEVAKAIASAAEAEGKSGIYNVCSNNPVPLKELVTMIRNKINPDFQLNFGALPYREGQCFYMEGSTEKLEKNLYHIDTCSFEAHLNETIEYYLNKYRS